jgi:hypothetical protein
MSTYHVSLRALRVASYRHVGYLDRWFVSMVCQPDGWNRHNGPPRLPSPRNTSVYHRVQPPLSPHGTKLRVSTSWSAYHARRLTRRSVITGDWLFVQTTSVFHAQY